MNGMHTSVPRHVKLLKEECSGTNQPIALLAPDFLLSSCGGDLFDPEIKYGDI